jgi:asparagine synthase (glutamine-hydrolysing)
MCSISGILSLGPIARDAVARMNRAQQHRGPDDSGIAEVGRVILGNTRLAIIDTSSAGHQPMNDSQTGNWITYNGETYNFKDLRHELGDSFTSNTDTEVVLRAYGRWGVEAFRRLRGMFALASWDDGKQTLFLARDPLGIKPLYYYTDHEQFIFASELRALLASGLVPRSLSVAGIDSYLASGSVAAPLTVIEGVRQLLPGHCLQVKVNGRIELHDVEFAIPKQTTFAGNRDDAVAHLRSELEESVRLHLVSDVPLGVFLSGGMDSSAIVGLLSRVSEQRPKTFSVVFDEAAYTEAPFSRAVAERFNTDHSEIHLGEDRLLEILPGAIAAIDQPTMDGINTFVVSSAVKSKGITVALSGLGGDELFAGYPSFRRALRFGAMPPASKRVLRAASGVGKFALNGSVQRQKFWQLMSSDGRPEDVYRISRQLFSRDVITQMTGRIDANLARNGHRSDPDIVNAISQLEMRGYMTNTLLRDTDAMSLAHSLEVRVPFVDVKLVDFVLSLPGEWKLRDGSGPKPLLAEVMSDLLPREFMGRPKMGFTLPFEKWMQGKLRDEISGVMADEKRLSLVGLNAESVRQIWKRFLQSPKAVGWTRPWAIYVLVKWCEVNGIS